MPPKTVPVAVVQEAEAQPASMPEPVVPTPKPVLPVEPETPPVVAEPVEAQAKKRSSKKKK